MSSRFQVLTPAYGLGSRTGIAINISSPRSKLGSQGRIYAWYRARGQGQYYEQLLINSLGIKVNTHDQNMTVSSDVDDQPPSLIPGGEPGGGLDGGLGGGNPLAGLPS